MNKNSYNQIHNSQLFNIQQSINFSEQGLELDSIESQSKLLNNHSDNFDENELLKKNKSKKEKIMIKEDDEIEKMQNELTMEQYLKSLQKRKQKDIQIKYEIKKKIKEANNKVNNLNHKVEQNNEKFGYSRKIKKVKTATIKQIKKQQIPVKSQNNLKNPKQEQKKQIHKQETKNQIVLQKRVSKISKKSDKDKKLLEEIDQLKPFNPQDYSSFKMIKVKQEQQTDKEKSIIISEKSQSSELERSFTDTKSYYSLAISTTSKSKKKKKRSSKSRSKQKEKEKKNFKKALIQKKFNTSHISETHHKIEKQNELYVRDIRNHDVINFGQIIHDRKNTRNEQIQKIKQQIGFQKIRKSIERDMNQPISKQIQNFSATDIFIKKQIEFHVQDKTSPDQNIDIVQYQYEKSSSDEQLFSNNYQKQQVQNKYEAIETQFNNRQNHIHNSGSKQNIKSKYSSKNESIKQNEQQLKKQSKQEEQRRIQYENLLKQKQQQRKIFIADQIFSFVKDIKFEQNKYFQKPLKSLIKFVDKIKYSHKQSLFNTRQQTLLIIAQILKERDLRKQQKQILFKKQKNIIELLGNKIQYSINGQPSLKKSRYEQVLTKLLTVNNQSEQILEMQDQEEFDNTIQIQKIVIGRLVSKVCELVNYSVKSLKS